MKMIGICPEAPDKYDAPDDERNREKIGPEWWGKKKRRKHGKRLSPKVV